jgi:2-methylcitrate dehydratase
LSVWKAVAAGEAGRAGLFSAMLARAGMAGPNLPFVGKNGWCRYVSGKAFSLEVLGGGQTPFKIQDTLIKQRASCATTISSILAAEKIAPIKDPASVEKVTVEVCVQAKEGKATGDHHWNPDSKETADHSIPYVTAATLIDGTISARSFTDGRISDPALRNLLSKVEVIANDEFTRVYDEVPIVHAARVTVLLENGERLVGESGGKLGDLSQPKSDAEIDEKFRAFTEEYLGARGVRALLEQLWQLERCDNVAALPSALIIA